MRDYKFTNQRTFQLTILICLILYITIYTIILPTTYCSVRSRVFENGNVENGDLASKVATIVHYGAYENTRK